MTNKSILALILVAFGGFGCAVEAQESAGDAERLEQDDPGMIVLNPGLYPIDPPPVAFEHPTPHAAAGPAASRPQPGSVFDDVDPSAGAPSEPGSTFDDVDPSAEAPSEPGSTFDDVDPSDQVSDDDAAERAKGAPGATGYDDPTLGAYAAGCMVVDADTGEWVIEPCPES